MIDVGLGVRDVARLVGTFEWPVADLVKDGCQVADVTVSGTSALAGAFILAAPRSSWPSALVYTVNVGDSSDGVYVRWFGP